jgi:hypothetical protein
MEKVYFDSQCAKRNRMWKERNLLSTNFLLTLHMKVLFAPLILACCLNEVFERRKLEAYDDDSNDAHILRNIDAVKTQKRNIA